MGQRQIESQQDVITHYMYLGLLPFFASALGPWILPESEVQLTRFLLFYSAVILVFLAGAMWAIALFVGPAYVSPARRHIHIAILFSLWPVGAYFLMDAYAIALMAMGFLLLLFWEKCFFKTIYPAWYQVFRHKITFIVVACHMLALFNTIRS